MPQAKQVDPAEARREATEAFVTVAFDDAYEIAETYTEVVEKRKANREQLRSLAAQGHLSAEQVEEMNELYPRRTKAEEAAEEAGEEPTEPTEPTPGE